MKNKILPLLSQIEQEENVFIFYACESGSRAWGFPSQDSDYDVRFLYVHPTDWYLSINEKREVIERPLEGALDVSGWEMRKALNLFRKSNPPLLEWLRSPIVYQEKLSVAQRLRALLPEFYSPTACLYHYLHMARGNLREYLKGEEVWTKKYFYILRPILACMWIERDWGPVPMEFGVLLERIIEEPKLKAAVMELLERKKTGEELSWGPRISVISDFLEAEFARLEAKNFHGKKPRHEVEKLNVLFRETLREVWGY